MTQTQANDDDRRTGMSRRDLLRRGTAAGIAVGTVGYGSLRIEGGPVGNSQAIAPVVVAGAVGGAAAVGWALREYEVIGSDEPAEGLTAEALKNEVYTTARTRTSTNNSTFVDNQNIIDGMENTAYADGKIAAIDALNNQKTESEVLNAATNAVDDYQTTVVKNLLKSWNESVLEFYGFVDSLDAHPDIGVFSTLDFANYDDPGGKENEEFQPYATNQYTLADGSTMDLHRVKTYYEHESINDDNFRSDWDPTSYDRTSYPTGQDYVDGSSHPRAVKASYDGSSTVYLDYSDWNPLYDSIVNTFQDVRDGLSTWVSNVYGDVQAGELDTSELLTPREQAELTSDDEDFPQALADLQALNISVDLEREAEVYLPNTDATISGNLGYTGDKQLNTGTVDPDATDDNGDLIYPGSFYITYDISQGEGTWSEYNEGIDGGVMTFTAEPYEETDYTVTTSAGETVTVVSGDFNDEGDGTWTVDLSDDLETAITNVEEIKFYAQSTETQYETIQLDQKFEIKGFTDDEGNEYQSSNFERSEPQTDDNYISEEEWKEQQKRNEELIEKFEESQETSGIGLSSSDGGLIAAVAGGLALLWVFGGS